MSSSEILGIVCVGLGAMYLLVAGIVYLRSRKNRPLQQTEPETIVTVGNDIYLIEGEMAIDRMRKLGSICVSTVKSVFNEQLDYTPESIARLDKVIIKGWGGGDSVSNRNLYLAFGAYIGDTLVRNSRGRWVSELDDEDPASVFFITPDDSTVNVSPFLMIREKFGNMHTFDLGIAYTAMEQKLKELGAR